VSSTALFDMSLLWSIAWRFLRGRRSRLMDSTARAALIAITIGVTAMVIAMALMTGYQKDLQQKLVRGNAAIIVYPLAAAGLQLSGEELTGIEFLPGVVEVRRVTYGQGSVASEQSPDGLDVTLRGVDQGQGLGSLGAVVLDPGLDPDRPLEGGEIPGVVLGNELARKLGIGLGDALRLMVLGFDGRRGLGFEYRSVEVVGTFTTGFSEFDQSWVVIGRSTLEGLMGHEVGSALYEIELADANAAGAVAGQIREVLGSDFLVTDWRDLNRELFTALEVQKIALFFVLGLIVVVSTFNVASSLVVLVRERMRDVGVLASLGLSPQELRTVFLLYGGALGLAGTLCGVALGVAASWVLTEYELIRFDPDLAEIYFIDSVPFRVEAPDILAVIAFTLLVTLVACWLPARRAGSVLPATALRYE
jgi:lipoprotein-releasing system permease protein